MEALGKQMAILVPELIDIEGQVSVSYKRGWGEDENLSETLMRCRERDQSLGYTRDGPHRAEIQVRVEGQPVKDFLSRGQQKMLVYSMFFAQAETLSEFTSERALILADDLSAEIDERGMERLVSVMRRICDQAVITNQLYVPTDGWEKDTLFHVKQGKVYSA